MTSANDSAPAPTPEERSLEQEPASPAAENAISIQAVPPGQATSTIVQAPAAPPPFLTAERLAREIARLDRVLVGIVLLLAFCVASFVARNSDVWMHLATGRAILRGEYRFHGDPFAYTTPNERTSWLHPGWVNPGWLSDVLFYAVCWPRDGEGCVLNGAIPVVIKALLIAILAAVLLLVHRRGHSLWIPAVSTALAILAMSPRLMLQPTCISLLFLGLTVYLLQRPQEHSATVSGLTAPPCCAGGYLRSWWTLPVLFALWANLDAWFLLGPLTVGLYLAGEALQQALAPARTDPDAPRPGEVRNLTWVFLAGLAACIVNPYHVNVFALPPELWAAVSGKALRNDAFFASLFQGPLGGSYFRTGGGPALAALAYVPLVVLGVASFALNGGRQPWWRVSVWVIFFALSVWLIRAIPFFAVVAAPITALNLQDFAARRLGTLPRMESPWKQWSLGGRLLSVAAGLLLLALAWPGWLHAEFGDPRSERRMGWSMTIDPSLRATAARLCTLQEQGVLTHGFNYVPDVASYCAWFCPREKGFYDFRFSLFSDVSPAYVDVRKALHSESQTPESTPEGLVVREVFRHYNINHLVVNSADPETRLGVMSRLLGDPVQWSLLYMDGRTVIFGWVDPDKGLSADPFRNQRLDLNALAFGPNLPAEVRVPAEVPPSPQPRSLWMDYSRGAVPRPLEADAAEMYLFAFAQSAAQGRPAPAALTLSIRAARRAVAAAPQDPSSYVALADAYGFCLQQEAQWSHPFPYLRMLRQAQLVNALQHALVLEPNLQMAHWRVANTFRDMNYMDLAVDEWKSVLDLVGVSGKQRRESTDDFKRRVADLAQSIEAETKTIKLQSKIDDYELRAKDKPPARRAQIALENGLAGQALKTLMDTEPAQLGQEGVDLELHLLIMTGQADEARKVEASTSHLNQFLLGGALGDYEVADKGAGKVAQELSEMALQLLLGLTRAQTLAPVIGPDSLRQMNEAVSLERDRANVLTVRALLALEAGATGAAADDLCRVLALSSSRQNTTTLLAVLGSQSPMQELLLWLGAASSTTPPFDFEARPLASRYASLLESAFPRSAQ